MSLSFTDSINKIVKKIPSDQHSKTLRKQICSILRQEYTRGYNKGIKENEIKYVLVETNKQQETEYYTTTRKKAVISDKDIDTLRNYIEVVGFDIFNINSTKYTSKSRKREIADYHKCVFYILRECGLFYTVIGRIFGKDHSTVVTAVKAFHTLIDTDPEFFSKFHSLVKNTEKMINEINLRFPIGVLIKAKIYNSSIVVKTK